MQSSESNLVGSSVGNFGTVISESREDTEARQMQRFKLIHIIFGVVEIVVGIVMFALDMAATNMWNNSYNSYIMFTYSGVWAGACCMLTGIFAIIAGVKSNRSWIMVCMVMCIFASIVCFGGLCSAVYEYTLFMIAYSAYATSIFSFFNRKCYTIIISCLAMFVVTIIHSTFCCRTVCECCGPSQPRVITQPTTTTTYVYQQYPGQIQTGVPPQQQTYPGQQQTYPLQQQTYPLKQQTYPLQQQTYPLQQQTYPPPTSTKF